MKRSLYHIESSGGISLSLNSGEGTCYQDLSKAEALKSKKRMV